MELQWRRRKQGCTSTPAPVVALLAWVGAKEQYIAKYVELLHGLGCDVLVAKPPTLAMWVPVWASRNARLLLDMLDAELGGPAGARPVVFMVFSGAAKGCYYRALQMMAGVDRRWMGEATMYARVRACCVGQIFDSCPVDFTSKAGQRLVQPEGDSATAALGRWSAALAAGTLDFALLEVFEAERAAMWDVLANPPISGPVLFLYSRRDDLAEAHKIAGLASSLRAKGRPVLEQVWHDTPHVGHLRARPQEYGEAVRYLISQASAEWRLRLARRAQHGDGLRLGQGAGLSEGVAAAAAGGLAGGGGRLGAVLGAVGSGEDAAARGAEADAPGAWRVVLQGLEELRGGTAPAAHCAGSAAAAAAGTPADVVAMARPLTTWSSAVATWNAPGVPEEVPPYMRQAWATASQSSTTAEGGSAAAAAAAALETAPAPAQVAAVCAAPGGAQRLQQAGAARQGGPELPYRQGQLPPPGVQVASAAEEVGGEEATMQLLMMQPTWGGIRTGRHHLHVQQQHPPASSSSQHTQTASHTAREAGASPAGAEAAAAAATVLGRRGVHDGRPAAAATTACGCSGGLELAQTLGSVYAHAGLVPPGCGGCSSAGSGGAVDCACCELMAAACGAVTLESRDATLAHSLRCMHRSVLVRQHTLSDAAAVPLSAAAAAASPRPHSKPAGPAVRPVAGAARPGAAGVGSSSVGRAQAGQAGAAAATGLRQHLWQRLTRLRSRL